MLAESHWHIAPLQPLHYLLFTVCIVFLFVICTKVYRRYQTASIRYKKPFRMVITTLLCVVNSGAVIAMLLLLLPIEQLKSVSEQAIIFTENSNEHSIQQAITHYQKNNLNTLYVLVNDPNQRIELADKLSNIGLLKDVQWISSTFQLLKKKKSLNHLFIYGDGLSSAQLTRIKNDFSAIEISYFPTQEVLGIVEPQWPKSLILGANATFSGKLQSSHPELIYQIELTDINQELLAQASVRASEYFRFHFTPKTLGVTAYNLTIRNMNTKQPLVEETIHLEVTQGERLNILVKTASPSFEVRHLKNWLTEQGSKMTIVSQTSKAAYLTQTVNNETENLLFDRNMTTEYLSNFDMLMLDGRTLISLSQMQQTNVIEAIKQGLALSIFVDDSLVKNHKKSQQTNVKNNQLIQYIQSFSAIDTKAETELNKPTDIHFQEGTEVHSLTPINFSLSAKFPDYLVTNDVKQPLVISHSIGLGSITLSTINTSYQWKLNGLNQQYGQYWQYLLGKIISTNKAAYWLTQSENIMYFPYENVALCYFSTDNNMKLYSKKLINNQDQKIASTIERAKQVSKGIISGVSNNIIDREFNYCSDWLLGESGWYQMTLSNEGLNEENRLLNPYKNDETLRIYVNNASEWGAWQQLKKQTSMRQYINAQQTNNIVDSEDRHIMRSPINKLPLWLLFISCCSVLWLERKTFQS
ncbi:MAG: hypothetical protein ACPG46_09135 [Thalassotalea sp.]